jgi:capsular exopolysaccharide synthesis family protein
MSQIFDALQRSENELRGDVQAEALEATELLKRAEKKAASEWEPESSRGSSVTEARGTGAISAAEEPLPNHELDSSSAKLAGTEVHGAKVAFSEFQDVNIPEVSGSWLVGYGDSDSPAREAFRLLAVRIRILQKDHSLKKILITSTVPEEGKSLIAANLACTLGKRTQQTVLLLEGDIRRPALSQLFGLETKPGISECLQDDRGIEECIYNLVNTGMYVLPAGTARINPLEVVQSAKLSDIMNKLGSWFDWIIIDSPPVLPLADTSIWIRLAEGVLLVTRQGVTRKKQLLKGLETLDSKKLIGAVLNSASHPEFGDYYYYYKRYAGPGAKAARET